MEPEAVATAMKCPACCDDLVIPSERCPRCAAGVDGVDTSELAAAVDEVTAAFERIPAAAFGPAADREQARAALVREGLFRELVQARAARQSTPALVAAALQRPGVRAVQNHRGVLLAWLTALGPPRPPPPALTSDARDPESIAPPPRGKGPRVDHRRVLERVATQRRLIAYALGRGEVGRAAALVDELVAFQLGTGKPIHLVKSLCSLAMEAQRHGEYALQIDLLERATRLKGDDAWAWAQLGKAQCNASRFDEALAAYHNASLFGQPEVALRGKADVLKTMGRLDEARIAYEEAILAEPSDPVAQTGYADVLKVMGRLDEALCAYARIAAEHPDSVFAKTGRADVLKSMGRFDEALHAFEVASREHPDNVVAKTGRARVLEAMGRLEDALFAFERAAREHPFDAGARTGRAHVLEALGQGGPRRRAPILRDARERPATPPLRDARERPATPPAGRPRASRDAHPARASCDARQA